jgi:hypothetical protein
MHSLTTLSNIINQHIVEGTDGVHFDDAGIPLLVQSLAIQAREDQALTRSQGLDPTVYEYIVYYLSTLAGLMANHLHNSEGAGDGDAGLAA